MPSTLTKIGGHNAPPQYHFRMRAKIFTKPPAQQLVVQLSAFTTCVSHFDQLERQLLRQAGSIVEREESLMCPEEVELCFVPDPQFDTTNWIVERF